ncbi:MAG TPA: recombinase family protein, partial [Solirubrobacteraceae bacterium]|nr:recombinase family protein [Solirubrobacteraceae bacterium]
MSRTKKPLPFARYARVSRVGGRSGEGYISIPEQDRKMKALAKTEGVPLTEELFKDEDRSGANLDRPEFQRALGLIRDGKLGGIAVAKLDRFSRDTEDFLTTLREIEQLGGRLLCGDGAVSLQNGTDTFIATVRVAAAALERDQRREDLKKSVRNALDRGVHLAAPYGYRKRDGRGSPLEPEPDEAAVVVEMFELRAAGWTWPKIASKLNADGHRPRPYRRWVEVDGVKTEEWRQARWTPKGVRQMVMNEVYLGVAFNGEHRTPGAHDPIVGAELFAAARRAKGVKPQGPR